MLSFAKLTGWVEEIIGLAPVGQQPIKSIPGGEGQIIGPENQIYSGQFTKKAKISRNW
jgi:hypothetical protein